MALVKFGMIVTDMRGSLGGHVFTKGRSGAVARTKVTPINPQTSFQQNVRSRLGTVSQTWRTLTEGQRDAWNAAVDNFIRTNVFGDSVKASGKNLFTLININLINIGQAQVTEPPVPSVLIAPALSSLTINIATNVFNLIIDNGAPLQSVIVYATAPLSAGVSFVKSEFRQIGVLAPQTAGLNDLDGLYRAKFGAPIAFQKVFVKVKAIITATGEPGVEEIISTIAIP